VAYYVKADVRGDELAAKVAAVIDAGRP
jgi:hypothetical protein